MVASHIERLNQLRSGMPVNNIHQNHKHPYPGIKFRHTSTKEIEKVIKSLKTKNVHGYDEISVKIIKQSAPFISSPLTYICNKSLELGIFPSRLKYSTVKPIFKKGDRQNAANYRPISLLISFSKIFEKIIYTRIYEHVTQNQILTKEQYGFRLNLSTDNASYTLTHEILMALNNKHCWRHIL